MVVPGILYIRKKLFREKGIRMIKSKNIVLYNPNLELIIEFI